VSPPVGVWLARRINVKVTAAAAPGIARRVVIHAGAQTWRAVVATEGGSEPTASPDSTALAPAPAPAPQAEQDQPPALAPASSPASSTASSPAFSPASSPASSPTSSPDSPASSPASSPDSPASSPAASPATPDTTVDDALVPGNFTTVVPADTAVALPGRTDDDQTVSGLGPGGECTVGLMVWRCRLTPG